MDIKELLIMTATKTLKLGSADRAQRNKWKAAAQELLESWNELLAHFAVCLPPLLLRLCFSATLTFRLCIVNCTTGPLRQ